MIFLLYILSQVFSVVPFPSHHQVSPSSSHFPDAVIYLLQVPIIMFLFTYYSLRNLLILLPLHLSSWEFISPCASYYVHLSKCTFSFIKIIDHYFFLISHLILNESCYAWLSMSTRNSKGRWFVKMISHGNLTTLMWTKPFKRCSLSAPWRKHLVCTGSRMTTTRINVPWTYPSHSSSPATPGFHTCAEAFLAINLGFGVAATALLLPDAESCLDIKGVPGAT